VIDTTSRNNFAKIAVPDTPLGIAADPAGHFIYVAGYYQPRLYKIDLATGTIAATAEVGVSPSGVAVTPDGALIATADRDDNQISIIDAKTLTRKSIVKVGAHPFGVPQMSKATTCPSSISRRLSLLAPWRSASGPTPSRWRRGAAFRPTNMAERFLSTILRRSSPSSGFPPATTRRG
jgi:YVTN family beta-propeller protein